MEIQYFNRTAGKVETEKVYGEWAINWLYGKTSGKILSGALVKRPLSWAYGLIQDSWASKKKVLPFIQDFNIPIEDFLPEEGHSEEDPYPHFNSFFIRRFREGKRPICQTPEQMAAPCEARYFGWNEITEDLKVPVKGHELDPLGLIGRKEWAKCFEGGPLYIARLCPVDYHRFHFPDSGEVLDQYRVAGDYHSVNPLALSHKGDIFLTNERQVAILETKEFGKLAYIEVGALCVGKIQQTYTGKSFERGQEKGLFLFGGSTVIVLGEKGKWSVDQDIADKTYEGVETLVRLGDSIGHVPK